MENLRLNIKGMTCTACPLKIENKLKGTEGINSVSVNYNLQTANIEYDKSLISKFDIEKIIFALGYEVADVTEVANDGADEGRSLPRLAGILLIVLAAFVILQNLGVTSFFSSFQAAEEGMGYGMLFVIGLVTSVHCIAMCGGINLSQCIPAASSKADAPCKAANNGAANNVMAGKKLSAIKPSLQYNLSRVVSYTIVGGIVGAVGSVITFNGGMKGIVQIVAGIFMVIMGLNMLGIFPSLRKIVPKMPSFFANKIYAKEKKSKSPIIIGLLNGLMPCGPLQAMQLFALSTGSPFKGALSMFLFAAGTLPLMFGLGAISSILTKRWTAKIMTVGAALVMVLGLTMFTQGTNLSGINLPSISQGKSSSTSIISTMEGDTQVVNSTLESGRYPDIVVKKGVPLEWIINAPEGTVNGCNSTMYIPEFDLEYTFHEGENTLSFTPEKEGVFNYSCWMGMIRGSITVE